VITFALWVERIHIFVAYGVRTDAPARRIDELQLYLELALRTRGGGDDASAQGRHAAHDLLAGCGWCIGHAHVGERVEEWPLDTDRVAAGYWVKQHPHQRIGIRLQARKPAATAVPVGDWPGKEMPDGVLQRKILLVGPRINDNDLRIIDRLMRDGFFVA